MVGVVSDRLKLFLEMAKLHAKMGHIPEAAKVMSDAKVEFTKQSEVVRISLADAELALQRQDYQMALSILKTVPSDSVYFTRAKMKMADIYLKYKKNKRAYALCYQQLAYEGNTVHTYILLGEAYMRIQVRTLLRLLSAPQPTHTLFPPLTAEGQPKRTHARTHPQA